MNTKKDHRVAVMIAVHSCLPENQKILETLLLKAAKEFYSQQPGFISSSLHVSLDGKAVTNYAQWEKEEDLANARNNPLVESYIQPISALLTNFEGHLYYISSTIVKD